jgi:transposase
MPTTTAKTDPFKPNYAALLGLDWGDKSHAVALVCADGQREQFTLEHSAENLHRWLKQLQERFGARPVALAFEHHTGPLLHVLVQYPWLTIYPISPVTSARYRQAWKPSGASDDGPDALDILDLLEHHQDKLTALVQDELLTRKLAGLVEVRRTSVDTRTGVGHQLRSVLKTYFPQALDLLGKNLASPLALDFLAKWPDLISLKSARSATIKSFFYRHNLRRPELLEKHLQTIAQAVALTTDEAIVTVAIAQVDLLLEQLRVLQKHIAKFDDAIQNAFAQHPDAAIFGELPGAGPALAPRLAVAFGDDRDRYPSAASFQQYAGIAPVREKSGKREWIHWRWNAPVFLRQTLVEWAGQTVVWCEWAGNFYEAMEKRGKNRQTILRALAFKWARILWHCWKQRTPYDETKYLAAMKKRNSPYALSIQKTAEAQTG